MALRLGLLHVPQVPLEVQGIVPQDLRDLTLDQVRRLPLLLGNRTVDLGEFFSVDGDPRDECVEWEGDCTSVHWVGARQTRGHTTVRGPVGRHLGSEMNGGRIDVFGSAGDWAGAQLAGGLIHIHGSAGHRIGAAYRGSRRGMTGGTLLVDGSAGDEVGSAMRRGLIGIRESCGDFLGVSLCAGTIAVCGEVGIRCGAGMRRGTLILSGAHPVELPPTFRRSARVSLVALRLIFGQLEQAGLAVPPPMRTSAYELFQGDFLEGGRGEVLIGLPVVGSANLGL